MVSFFNAQVLMFPREKEIENGTLIGEEDKGLYKMKGQPK